MESTHTNDLLIDWIKEVKLERTTYREPILDEATRDKIKLFCHTLQQDTHVFFTAIEIIEEYITTKDKKRAPIHDPLLVIVTGVYIASKQTGELSDLKISNLLHLCDKLSHDSVTNRMVQLQEIDLLRTLKFKLPLHTPIDDLKAFLHYYMKPLKLKVDVFRIAEEFMNLFSIHQVRLFVTLKIQYLQNINAYNAFCCMYVNRLYFPIGILLCVFKVTKMSTLINTTAITKELSELSEIHSDHLLFLRDEMYNLLLDRINRTQYLQ